MANYIRFTQANRLTEFEVKAIIAALDFLELERELDPLFLKQVRNAGNKCRRALRDKPREGAG